ncbi:sucrose synthase 7-like protein [Tanacetum coccineum]
MKVSYRMVKLLNALNHDSQIYPRGSTNTLPYATMGPRSLAALAIFKSEYREGLTIKVLLTKITPLKELVDVIEEKVGKWVSNTTEATEEKDSKKEVSKPILSLNRKDRVTQEEFINTFTDNDGDENDSLLFSGFHWMMWHAGHCYSLELETQLILNYVGYKYVNQLNQSKVCSKSSEEDKYEQAQVLEGLLRYMLCTTQEAAIVPPYVVFAIIPNPRFLKYVKINSNDLTVEGITATDYLKFKEMIVDETCKELHKGLVIKRNAICSG